MAIVVPHDESAPLDQGDLLGGLKLYSTDANSEQAPKLVGRESYGLVISRPCVAVNKPRVVVALIEKSVLNLGDLSKKSLAEVVTAVTRMRDADGSDAFYLGELPGLGKLRYKANLDFFATLQVPTDPAMRLEWTTRHRIARLHADFRRDLHTRLFLSVAKQGFEDLGWLSDADLELLIDTARWKMSTALSEVDQARMSLTQAEGSDDFGRKEAGLQKTLRTAQESHKLAQDDHARYLDERTQRAARNASG